MPQACEFIGVDVAKAELVVCRRAEPGTVQAIGNNTESIASWLQALPSGSAIAMESTGIYHRLLVQLAHAAGFVVYVLNCSDVHFYAKALGGRGKTDRVDSVTIARYLMEHHASLRPWEPGGQVQRQLWDLLLRRAEVVKHQGSMRQTLRDMPTLSEAARQLDQQFKAFLEVLDGQIDTLVARDEQLRDGCSRLQTISGVGPQASSMLASLLSRIEFANADALVAFSGLDPRPNDSGNKRGRRRLSKRGPPPLRRMLYLVALAASRSKAVKPLYLSIKAKGFAPTQALVILARKLLRVIYAVWKSGKPFEAALLAPKLA